MKTVVAIGFITFQILLGCKSATVSAGEYVPMGHQDVVMEEEETPEKHERQESISLKDVIGNKNYAILENTDSIEISNIEAVLIEGTDNEYGRKIKMVKELKAVDEELLDTILNNENYIEINTGNFAFDPTLQFQLKHENEQLLLLLDEKTGTLSFTTVEGQTLLRIAEPLKNKLIVVSNN